MNALDSLVGGVKIFASGMVISRNDEPIRLLLFGSESSYFLELRFENDGGNPKIINGNEGFGHVVKFTNLGLDSLPTSNIDPLYVANSAGRKLYLNFAVLNVGSTPVTRVVNYTIFDGGVA